MKKILMVTFQYPPFTGSIAVQRSLMFSRYLPMAGWEPIILTASPKAYPKIGYDLLDKIPSEVSVERATALDSARHLAIRGRYFKCFALPDRWISWYFFAVPLGLKLIRKHKPDLIWTTYPLPTALLIGLTLHYLSGLPLVADFRDPMVQTNYPAGLTTWRIFKWIENKIFTRSSKLIFTAPSTMEMYRKRYPSLKDDQLVMISNGYDEEDFISLDYAVARSSSQTGLIRLHHSGGIHLTERDPRPLFRALSRLKNENVIDAQTVRIDLQGSGIESELSKLIDEFEIDDLVYLIPWAAYRSSLQNCASADALLILRGAPCNTEIAAKVYEYLRLGKPILALTDSKGDTASFLRKTGGATIVDLMDENSLFELLPKFLEMLRNNTHPVPNPEIISQYSRKSQALELGKVLCQTLQQV